MFHNKTILVTGGTGSWGNELVKQLLEKQPSEIRVFSRNESSQVAMKRAFHQEQKLKFIIGDIKEKDGLIEATKGVDFVFHLAALKHVPVCEDQPLEAMKTNVIGTQNVIDAAILNNVEKVIYISTDKAANPSNFYGFTKAMGERLIIHANVLKSNTTFVCVRGGNVLGTNGSVIHVFKNQIEERGKIGITDMRMTRFFLTLEDAIKLLFKATYESKGGEIFVMKMPTCKIVDLADVLIEASGKPNVEVEVLGIRPGEKLHELLFSEYESQSTVYYDKEYFVILPSITVDGLQEYYATFKQVELENYNSSENLMSKDELKKLLQKGGFIS
ncbi:polysaccharide biosynthesis protein [Guptibacillus algicola]|uniref:polysaccharide biosynthesis protein n=1 Tax=Guptibacillus algicola TaxID=225844 RepID=UPI001CD591FF|nr:polysaccharide biosynthesis protein [Alkalihalobacillus algicola]MCA0987853.1 polysaccharide biosynthesis protein [Alkalihalobacillus algicola]